MKIYPWLAARMLAARMLAARMLVAVFCVAGILAGCTHTTPSQPSPEGTNWKMATIKGQPALSGVATTISFSPNGQISGSTGCNQYIGTYAVKENLLTLYKSGSTHLACPSPVMAQETAFFDTLMTTATFVEQNNELQLKDISGKLLATFVSSSSTVLTNTQWSLASYSDGKGGTAALIAGSEITAVFTAEGLLSGNDGCNAYNTTYKADGEKIAIQPATTTKMACTQVLVNQEAQYLKVIEGAATYQIGDGTLELRGANGALIATFKVK